jgi:hypothetical protein
MAASCGVMGEDWLTGAEHGGEKAFNYFHLLLHLLGEFFILCHEF